MVAPLMSGWRWSGIAVLALAGFVVGGCGQASQDAHEPNRGFQMQVVKVSFPTQQAIARPSKLKLEVRNTGTSTIPNLAITIQSFAYHSDYPHLADNKRPVWIVDQGPGKIPVRPVQSVPFNAPGNDTTATSSTWAAGAVAAGQSRTFVWHVTPVKSGEHTITYTVAAGLGGKAHAEIQGGQSSTGHFNVSIAPQPPITHVLPNGKIAPGPPPVGP
jgi:hypothetical protein